MLCHVPSVLQQWLHSSEWFLCIYMPHLRAHTDTLSFIAAQDDTAAVVRVCCIVPPILGGTLPVMRARHSHTWGYRVFRLTLPSMFQTVLD